MFLKRKKKAEAERKERSDKKKQVAPYISVELKQEIERLAFITDQPIKWIGELLTYYGIHNKDVTERFAPYFQRGILRVSNTLYYGSPENPHVNNDAIQTQTSRISIRFTQRDYEDVSLLANLLDVTPSRAVSLLLDASIKHPEIIEHILQTHNNRMSFDEVTTAELRKFMRYVNRDNPYKTAWNEALISIVDGARKKIRGLTRKVPPEAVDNETYNWRI